MRSAKPDEAFCALGIVKFSKIFSEPVNLFTTQKIFTKFSGPEKNLVWPLIHTLKIQGVII